MADQTPTRFLSQNGGSDKTALALKVFSGEVLTSFYASTVTVGRHSVRSIPSGKSAQHIVTGTGTASYHTPGAEINGTDVLASERTIVIDDLLIAPRAIASIDEAMSQYDMRAPLATDIGQALAQTLDKHVLQVGLLAARAAATVTGGNGGSALTKSTAFTSGDDFVAQIFLAAQKFDEKNVPKANRYCFVPPSIFYNLVNASKVTNFDYTGGPRRSNGGVDTGVVLQIAGIEIVSTNNLPNGVNIASGPTAYQGDFTNTAALIMQMGAVGTTKLIDLRVESEYEVRYQSTLLVGKIAVGHGILRPECSIEVKTA